SANVQKVTWLCDEINLAYDREDVGGKFGKNDQPEYLAMNPNGRVPTIVDDGFVLWESNACVQYLASKHAAGSWYPNDLKTRGSAVRWMDWTVSTLSPAHAPVFQGLIRTPPEKRNMDTINAAREGYSKQMRILDNRLADHAFLAGDSI